MSWEGVFVDGDDSDTVQAVLLSEGSEVLPPLIEVLVSVRGKKSIRVVKPPGVDELWQWYEQTGSREADPSWGKIWETSRALAACILCETEEERSELGSLNVPTVLGKRIAEVGCGLGLAGLTAAVFAKSASVVFCDREPVAIHCALSSAAINGIEVVACSDLDTNGGAVKVAGALLDWAAPQELSQQVDTVIGADCLYDPDTAALLAGACRVLVRGCGSVVLCEPSKERALGCRQAFLTAAVENGASRAEVVQLPPGIDDNTCCVLVVAAWET
eukprot:CAMPEP_0181363036 /NCGR_PEP_ID=MMETSP1106-20121128/8440_1 /TAXON_ID=81844 /ORGANISM="Mantoniella antarctica, Strain SL-175" /LENGTH=273 /DNA_ID=CAMNT_0023477259 /DNA_START=229 /DNA_END=1050 /DNA_ORIENTATION=+